MGPGSSAGAVDSIASTKMTDPSEILPLRSVPLKFQRDIKSKASRLEPVSSFVAICCSGCREQKGRAALLWGERGAAVPERRVLSVY